MVEQRVLVGPLPLREEQAELAGAILARAFQGYPLMVEAFPDPAERARLLPPLQTWGARHALLFGEVLAIGDPPVGVAIAYPPGDDLFSREQMAASGFDRMAEVVGAADWRRAHAALTTLFDHGEEQLAGVIGGPRRYRWLEAIAVAPEWQGAGLGSALLAALDARADAAGVPTVLLTHEPRTLPFYRRHGYELVCEGAEPTSGLRHWGLRRGPQAPADGGAPQAASMSSGAPSRGRQPRSRAAFDRS